MPFGGIDIGSTMTKVVITDEQEKILASHIGPTGAEHRHLALKVMDETLLRAGIAFESLDFIVATGYGRINVPFADKQITEQNVDQELDKIEQEVSAEADANQT